HALGGLAQERQLAGSLARSQKLEDPQALNDLAVGDALAQSCMSIGRQETHFDAYGPDRMVEPPQIIGAELHRIDGPPAPGLDGRSPELVELLLVALERIAEIRRLVGPAFRIDENGEVAANPDRVHVVEEKEAITAEQILDVVLRRYDQGVDAGFIHQGV